MDIVLDFERPILELRRRIEQLRALDQSEGVALESSISQLESQATELEYRIFNGLTPWQRTLIARHPERPYMLDYVEGLFSEWEELHGDRAGFDDSALIGGIARFAPKSPPIDESLVGQPVVIIGHQKGRNTKENILRNFGMARPEGYRKALRLMKLADRFGLPIIALIDTPGAYPGIDAEERGQAEAIARNIMEMSQFRVPIIAIVTGEGGSGGALAIGVANRVLMLGNSVYSVISPEGCAAILWRDRSEGPRAAEALQITANDCKNLGVIDEVIEEPLGGSHRHPERTMGNVERAIGFHLHELLKMTPEALVENRHSRFRKMGSHVDPNQVAH